VVDPQDRTARLRPGPQTDPTLAVLGDVVPYGVVREVDHQPLDQLGIAQHGRGAESGPHARPAVLGPAVLGPTALGPVAPLGPGGPGAVGTALHPRTVRQAFAHQVGEVDELPPPQPALTAREG